MVILFSKAKQCSYFQKLHYFPGFEALPLTHMALPPQDEKSMAIISVKYEGGRALLMITSLYIGALECQLRFFIKVFLISV